MPMMFSPISSASLASFVSCSPIIYPGPFRTGSGFSLEHTRESRDIHRPGSEDDKSERLQTQSEVGTKAMTHVLGGSEQCKPAQVR